MSTEFRRTCPRCGNELFPGAQFCPICLLRQGLAGKVQSGEPSLSDDVFARPKRLALRFEHYEVVTSENGAPVELGRGAMGVTYKALDVDLRRSVTLKVIRKSIRATRRHAFAFFMKPAQRPVFVTRMLLRSSI